MKWWGIMVLWLVFAFGGAVAAQTPADYDKLKGLLDAQQQQIQIQQQQLDAQRQQLDLLKKQLDEMRKPQAAAQAPEALAAGTSPPPSSAPAATAQTPAPQTATVTPVSPAIGQRTIMTQDTNAAARLDNAPIDPEMRGFIAIPGTVSRFRFGGFAKLDVIHDFEPAGEADSFITSTIPVDPKPDAQNTSISARQTRFSIDFRRPTPEGDLRVYFENDFYGNSGATNFHLTQAYGQVWNFLAGYTYSTLMDVDSMPETLDYQGPGSMIYVKQPQIRYTVPLDKAKKHTLAFGIERATSDIITSVPNPGVTITPTTPWPDAVIRYRYEDAKWHFQAGLVLRSVGGYATGLPNRHVFAWGLNLTGSVQSAGTDSFLYQFSGGRGMGRYAEDVAGLAPDVGVNASGDLVALPLTAGFLGYQHYWSENLRSTITYGYLKVDSTGYRYTTDFTRSDYGAVNLIWNPKGTAFNMGAEYLYGDHVISTGPSGHANRLQFSFLYDLLKMVK